MAQTPYLFTQLTSFLSKDKFDRIVNAYNGNAYVKNLTCWNHLLVMMWAQLTGRSSLRDIVITLKGHSDKVYRMGIGSVPARNTLAHANQVRPVGIYREMAQVMMDKAARCIGQEGVISEIVKGLGLSGFLAIDSSTVTLPLRRFPWSTPQEGCGGIKMHVMYDILRQVPNMCCITGHEERDQSFMELYPYVPGNMYVFDRMYFKTVGFARIAQIGAYFVTRMKKNVVCETVESHPTNGNVMTDRTVRLTGRYGRVGYPFPLRIIDYYSIQQNEVLRFVTNHFALDAEMVATLYRNRWEIELFFKWIKQHLHITEFYGTSANAVMIQIYTAVISFCTLALAKNESGYSGSLYDFTNLVSLSLTSKEWLDILVRKVENAEPIIRKVEMPTLF